MINFKHAALAAALMGSVALPALAQSPAAGNATTAPATHDLRPATGMPNAGVSGTAMPNGTMPGAVTPGLGVPGNTAAGTTNNNTTTATGATSTRMTGAASMPSDRNAALTDGGNVRASKVVGSSVYNGNNEKVGTVDDILLGRDNKVDMVVLSVGGFLGMGKHYVSVPYSQLQLGDTRNASSHNKVVLPTASRDALKAMPEYRYTRS